MILRQNTTKTTSITLNGTPAESQNPVSSSRRRYQYINGKSRYYLSKTRLKETIEVKDLIYQTDMLNTLLYGSQTWTTYLRHEKDKKITVSIFAK